jgi:hypothetical protein
MLSEDLLILYKKGPAFIGEHYYIHAKARYTGNIRDFLNTSSADE